jgi:hypothetical protein
MRFAYKAQNVNLVVKQLRKLGTIGEKMIEDRLKREAFLLANDMKRRAPVDTGVGRASISVRKTRPLEYTIYMVEYMNFQEFGTGNRVRVPSMLRAYAAQFRRVPPKRQVNLPPQPVSFIYDPLKRATDNLIRKMTTDYIALARVLGFDAKKT